MTLTDKSTNTPSHKKRLAYLAAVFITILLGLSSRIYGHHLPSFIAQNAGDALWAMMIYFGLRFILIRRRLLTVALLSLLFCFAIEFSQLYQADWINQIRNTTLGALILGKGFLPADLIRYTAGILIAAVLDTPWDDSAGRTRLMKKR